MGIDVYLRWNGQTKDEEKAQYTGFSIQHGHVGYLREAYHGGPYATQVLAPECWQSNDGSARIPAATLRERLPAVIEAAKTRAARVYKETPASDDEPWLKTFRDFVDLAEAKERETGQPCTVISSY